MRTVEKNFLTIVLVLSMVCSGIVLTKPKYVVAKAVSKVTKMVTLTKKNAIDHTVVAGKEKVFVKVKVLSIKGKVKNDKNGDLLFGDAQGTGYGKGTLFASFGNPKLKKSSFKKGKVLPADKNSYFCNEKVQIGWWVPDGVKSIKVKITYYTKSGKAGIKSFKQKERKW